MQTKYKVDRRRIGEWVKDANKIKDESISKDAQKIHPGRKVKRPELEATVVDWIHTVRNVSVPVTPLP